jgi:UDP-3-O-[3-hydroxymyristoyl] N-acetylglucosamine deacetylase
MIVYRQQRTLRSAVKLTGFGYWSCRDVTLWLLPAACHQGRYFVREDVAPGRKIPARVEYCVEAPRRTALAVGNARVDMVEHVLAALASLQIDNCEIRVNSGELPAFDGSGQAIVEQILQAGIVTQNAARTTRVIRQPVRLGDSQSWIEARPSDKPGLSIDYQLDYGNGPIGKQHLTLDITPESFLSELAAARSFLLADEAEQLRNLGQGWRVTYQDILVFGPDGPCGNTLRYPDECVRHKILDLLGDLALADCELHGRIVAYRSGHRLNCRLVQAVLAQTGGGSVCRAA